MRYIEITENYGNYGFLFCDLSEGQQPIDGHKPPPISTIKQPEKPRRTSARRRYDEDTAPARLP